MSHEAFLLYQNDFLENHYTFKALSKTHRKGFTVNHETGLNVNGKSYNLKYYVKQEDAGKTKFTQNTKP